MGERKRIGWTWPAGETIPGKPMDVALETWCLDALDVGVKGARIMEQIGVSSGVFWTRMKAARARREAEAASGEESGVGADGEPRVEPRPEVAPRPSVEPRVQTRVSGAEGPSALPGATVTDGGARLVSPGGYRDARCPACLTLHLCEVYEVATGRVYLQCERCTWKSRLIRGDGGCTPIGSLGTVSGTLQVIASKIERGWRGDYDDRGLETAPTPDAADGGDGAAPVEIAFDDGGAQRLVDGVLGDAEDAGGLRAVIPVETSATALLAYVEEIGAKHDALVFCSGYNRCMADIAERVRGAQGTM